MCSVSAVTQNYTDNFPIRWPNVAPVVWPPNTSHTVTVTFATKAEVAALRAEVAELRKLVEAAKAFDAATNQPDCESEDKAATLRKLTEWLGVAPVV